MDELTKSKEVAEVYLTKLYHEVRTREVEDGWIEPHELTRPYPYRFDAGLEYRLVFTDGEHTAGTITSEDLEFIHHEEKGPVLIGVKGHLFSLAPDYRLVTDHKAV